MAGDGETKAVRLFYHAGLTALKQSPARTTSAPEERSGDKLEPLLEELAQCGGQAAGEHGEGQRGRDARSRARSRQVSPEI
jgi:hypothetical protein